MNVTNHGPVWSGVPSSPNQHAVAMRLQGFATPPHQVPLLVLDLDLDARYSGLMQQNLIRNGLEPVRSIGAETYEATARWLYDYVVGPTPTTGSVRLYFDKLEIFSGRLEVNHRWSEIERGLGISALVIGSFMFSEFSSHDPDIAQLQVDRLQQVMRSGTVVGATVGHRSNNNAPRSSRRTATPEEH